ncbi:MAG: hypothetical protein U0R64_08925 [Candidatus Nanopelagicales bacterium]
MTARHQDAHPPPAGAYPTGRVGVARHWDGHAWSGPAIPDDAAPAFPWHRRPWALPAHPLFWLTVGGIAVGCGLAMWAIHGGGTAVLAVAGLFGSGGPMAAFVLFVARRLRLPQVIGVGEWVLWAVLGAVVAGPLAYVLEGWLPNQGAWQGLAGPIEETSKILVPVVLFLVGRYRDPRAGVALAVGIGAIFGVAEGIEYVIDADQSGLRVHHPDSTTHLLKSTPRWSWCSNGRS